MTARAKGEEWSRFVALLLVLDRGPKSKLVVELHDSVAGPHRGSRYVRISRRFLGKQGAWVTARSLSFGVEEAAAIAAALMSASQDAR